MKKYLITILFLLLPIFTFAQSEDYFFYARVLKVLNEQEKVLENGHKIWQQELRLRVLSGPNAGQEIVFNGFEEAQVLKSNRYFEGNKVSMVASVDENGNEKYFVTDYTRGQPLIYITALFIIVLLAVGRFKGLRSLLSLALSFLVIIEYIIPQILNGSNPILVTVIGSLLILAIIIYITEGFKKDSHLAVVSIFIGLLISIFVSYLGLKFAHLSGLDSEEAFYLIEIAGAAVNFQGLLLAGIIIGTLGVIDDVVISQIAAVKQIGLANPSLNRGDLFARASQVGVSHISSMTNTLFLAYAGAALPLLIFFVSGESVFGSWIDIVNNEAIATEIVRTLCGSIGLILVVPISTFLASWKYSKL